MKKCVKIPPELAAKYRVAQGQYTLLDRAVTAAAQGGSDIFSDAGVGFIDKTAAAWVKWQEAYSEVCALAEQEGMDPAFAGKVEVIHGIGTVRFEVPDPEVLAALEAKLAAEAAQGEDVTTNTAGEPIGLCDTEAVPEEEWQAGNE